jgi:hypothetical protein
MSVIRFNSAQTELSYRPLQVPLFGPDAWQRHFGAQVVGPVPELPKACWDWWQGPDPWEDAMFVNETHFGPVWVSKELLFRGRKEPLDLNLLEKMGLPFEACRYGEIPAHYLHATIEHPCWVIMRKNLVGEGIRDTWKEAQKRACEAGYQRGPSAIHIAAALLAWHKSTHEVPFGERRCRYFPCFLDTGNRDPFSMGFHHKLAVGNLVRLSHDLQVLHGFCCTRSFP